MVVVYYQAERTVANVAVERFVDVVLLVFRAAYEDDAASVAFRAFCDAGNAPSLHRMIILHTNRNRILCTYKNKSKTKNHRENPFLNETSK